MLCPNSCDVKKTDQETVKTGKNIATHLEKYAQEIPC
jgi:hypothetical protein